MKVKKSDLCFGINDFKLNNGTRKFSGVLSSGKVVHNHGFMGDVIINLDEVSFSNPVKLLRQHDHDRVIGYGNVFKSDRGLEIEGSLIENEHSMELIELSEAGVRWEMSGHFNPEGGLTKLEPGQKRTVNGSDVAGPLIIFEKPRVREASIVTIGADAHTSLDIFSDQSEEINIKGIKMDLFEISGQDLNFETKVISVQGEDTLEFVHSSKVKEFSDKLNLANEEIEKLKVEFACNCKSYESEKKKFEDIQASLNEEIASLKEKLKKQKAKLRSDKFNAVKLFMPNIKETISDEALDELFSMKDSLKKNDAPAKYFSQQPMTDSGLGSVEANNKIKSGMSIRDAVNKTRYTDNE